MRSSAIHSAAVALGKRGGDKGGRARAKKLSPEIRSQIASYAASKRWGKASIYAPVGNASDWIHKAKGAVELLKYHDSVCPDYPLAQWFHDVLRLHSEPQNNPRP